MDDALQCRCVRTNGTLSIILSGTWKFGDVSILKLDDAIKHADTFSWNQLVVDITKMTTAGSAPGTDFIAEMVRILKLAKRRNAHWSIIAQSQKQIKVFVLCRLDAIFDPHIHLVA